MIPLSLRLLPLLAFLLAAAPAFHAPAQQAPPPPSIPGQVSPPNIPPPDPLQQKMLRRMARERNDDRQKTIVDDTNRLLKLAKELKADVDKSNKDTLSISVINKAAEIEKLAKQVRQKMRSAE